MVTDLTESLLFKMSVGHKLFLKPKKDNAVLMTYIRQKCDQSPKWLCAGRKAYFMYNCMHTCFEYSPTVPAVEMWTYRHMNLLLYLCEELMSVKAKGVTLKKKKKKRKRADAGGLKAANVSHKPQYRSRGLSLS